MNEAIVSFLKVTLPFSLLPQRLLGSEGDSFSARSLAAGEEILTAGTIPDAACVVRSGSLEATYAQCLTLSLLPGDMLGWEAALPAGQGAATGLWDVRAAENSEVILIPLEALGQLMADELFARSLAARSAGLTAAAARARNQSGQPGPDPFLRLRVGDVTCPAPVFVDATASVGQAARLMAQAKATAALVRAADTGNGAGGVLGILTERDVLAKVVAAGKDAETLCVTEVMTPGLVTAGPEELLIEAFSRMVHHGIRRLVLLDENGSHAGVLGERDMLSARGESPLAVASEIAAATAPEELARTFDRLHRMAGRSVAEGITSDAVGRLISAMHDRIMCRAWEMVLAELGPAPAPHAVLVLGSQGRREQFLATDQDLALAYDGSSGSGHGPELEDWFARLGESLTRMLLQVGFPPCKNRIMMDNPDWRKSLDGWLDLFDSIADRPDAEGILKASLLCDMRAVQVHGAGNSGLNVRLREAMTRRLRKSSVLLKYMAREAVRFSPPLGLFGSFSLKKDEQGLGVLDIKRGGIFPITQGVKTLALDHGLAETGTCARLRLLHRSEALSVPLAEGLCDAYDFLQTLRMRTQAAHLRQGKPLDNDIRPDTLGAMERERLRAAFKLTAEFQSLLFEKYSLRMLG